MKDSDFNFGTSCKAGNPLGGRWARYLRNNPAEKKEYDSLKVLGPHQFGVAAAALPVQVAKCFF